MSTNISDAHRQAFESLICGQYGNFALFSCFVNGQPAAAITAVSQDGGDYTIMPLFVTPTPDMILTDHDGRETRQPGPLIRA